MRDSKWTDRQIKNTCTFSSLIIHYFQYKQKKKIRDKYFGNISKKKMWENSVLYHNRELSVF